MHWKNSDTLKVEGVLGPYSKDGDHTFTNFLELLRLAIWLSPINLVGRKPLKSTDSLETRHDFVAPRTRLKSN